jgi:4-amino-4-deoxy-L-arabinose transferase-like glycosyltransferase
MRAPGHRFRKPPSDFVANFAPWSLLTLLGIWRIWSTPAPDDTARRFERFCFCWFVGGLLLFAISPHNPARLLYPIIPPAAIIAGREVARLARALTSRAVIAGCALATTVALTCFIVKYHHMDRRRQHVRKTLALLDLHAQVHERAGDDFPLTYVSDVPFALQLTFNTMRPTVTWQQAAALLRDDAPVYVVVHDVARLRRQVGSEPPPLYDVAECSLGSTSYVTIVSNRPALAWSDPIAMGLGPLRLRLRGVRVGPTQDGRIVLKLGDDSANASIVNGASEPTAVVLDLSGHALPSRQTRRLAAGEMWQVPLR